MPLRLTTYLPSALLRLDASVSFFSNHPPTTEIYTLSLHDALPISRAPSRRAPRPGRAAGVRRPSRRPHLDRKSTRLNSSHRCISYAVFCLKKKKKKIGLLEHTNGGTIFLK